MGGGASSQQHLKLTFVGLDGAGKSSLIAAFKETTTAFKEMQPTLGWSQDEFSKKAVKYTISDMSGESRYRELWVSQYSFADGIVFVVDATDRLRLVVAKDELDIILASPTVAQKDTPLLIFAHKVDLPDVMDQDEVIRHLGLERIEGRVWHVYSSSSVDGRGISEGMDWIREKATERKQRLSVR